MAGKYDSKGRLKNPPKFKENFEAKVGQYYYTLNGNIWQVKLHEGGSDRTVMSFPYKDKAKAIEAVSILNGYSK